MMLKITKTWEYDCDVHLKLDGKISAQWAALLDGVCRNHLRDMKVVKLAGANVDFVDASGIAVLNDLPQKRIVLINVPSFILRLLKTGEKP
jgi:ABC-type transporter Mla MlaB component